MDLRTPSSTTETNGPRISVDHEGLYLEQMVINTTNSPIVVMYIDGSRATVYPQPSSSWGRELVIIISRQTNGPRVTRSKIGVVENNGVITTTKIDAWKIQKGHLDEDTGLFCITANAADTVRHPHARPLYVDALSSMITNVDVLNSGSTRIELYANDPSGRSARIYACVCDQTFEIVCTDHYDGDSGASLNIVVACGDHRMLQNRIDIEELFTSGRLTRESDGSFISLGMSHDEACQASTCHARSIEYRVSEQVEQRVADRRKEIDDSLAQMKEAQAKTVESLKIDSESVRQQLKSVKTELDTKKLECAQMKSLVDHWESLCKVNTTVKTDDMKLTENESKLREQIAKEERANIAIRQENIKLLINVAKIVSGFVAGVCVPAIVGYLSKEAAKR